MEWRNRDRNTGKVRVGEDGKCAGNVAEVGETERRAKEGFGTGPVKGVRQCHTSSSTTPHHISQPMQMDGAGHLLSLKVMRVSVRVCPAIESRLFVISVPSSDPRWRAHGSLSTPTLPPSQPTLPPPCFLYKVARHSQVTQRHYATSRMPLPSSRSHPHLGQSNSARHSPARLR